MSTTNPKKKKEIDHKQLNANILYIKSPKLEAKNHEPPVDRSK
jgi:hypothetical protein